MRNEIEDRADDVRVLLETAQVPPARVDIARAIASGAQTRRRRRYAAAAAGATALAMIGVAAVGQVLAVTRAEQVDTLADSPTVAADPMAACTVRALPVPPKTTPAGTVVADPTGVYVAAGVALSGGASQAVLWTDGQPQVLKVGAAWVEPHGVNSAGVVVGMAGADSGKQFGWVYRDGDVKVLAAVPRYGLAVPYGVNEAGDIVGEAWTDRGNVAVVWPAAAPEKVRVLPAPMDARALGIGDDGTVVGSLGDGVTPYAWGEDGKGRKLAVPEGATGGKVTAVRGRWAVGWVGAPAAEPNPSVAAPPAVSKPKSDGLGAFRMRVEAKGGLVPARWDLTTGEVTTWPGRTEPASAVNARGWAVLPATPGNGPAMVDRDGALHPLPGSENTYPMSISDGGDRIFGLRVGTDPARARPELLAWTC